MKPPVGAFISASSVFPEITPGIETLRQTLESLDCREVTFMCARLNLIVSDQLIVTENNDSWEKRQSLIQSELAKALFSQRQIGRMNHFIRTSRIPNGEWTLIFRGQLLELIRWACRFCSKFPGQNLLGDPEVKEAFSKALLIASDLWH